MTETIIQTPHPKAADEIYYLRCFFGDFTLTFAWHEPLKAQKAHEEIERLRLVLVDRHDDGPRPLPIVAVTDDFSNSAGIDVSMLKATLVTSGQGAGDLQYALQYADMQAKKRYSERLEGNTGLYRWMRAMMQAGQQIIHPAAGMQQ